MEQRWAPGAYNPRATDFSLGISLHRTDLVKTQELPETRPGSGLDRARTHQGRVGTDKTRNQTEQVRLTVSNTQPRSIGYRLESLPGVCNHCNVKCSTNVVIKFVHITINAKNTMEISSNIVMRYEA